MRCETFGHKQDREVPNSMKGLKLEHQFSGKRILQSTVPAAKLVQPERRKMLWHALNARQLHHASGCRSCIQAVIIIFSIFYINNYRLMSIKYGPLWLTEPHYWLTRGFVQHIYFWISLKGFWRWCMLTWLFGFWTLSIVQCSKE
jgi:hypothetical protein